MARQSRLRSVVETLGANVIASALALVSSVAQARALAPAGRGEVVFLTLLANFTAVFAMCGVQASHSNIISQEPEKARTLATNSVVLALGLTAIFAPLAAAVLAVVGLKVQEQVGWPLTCLSLAAVSLVTMHTYFRFLAIAEYRFRLSNGSLMVVPATTFLVNAVLGLAGVLTVTISLCAWIGGYVIGLLMLLRWAVTEIGFGRWSRSLATRSLRFGLKNQVPTTMQWANFRLDQLFVGGISGSAALGVYSVAVAWAEALFYLPEAISQVQRPDLARAGRKEAADVTASGVRLTLVATALTAAVAAATASIMVDVIFGSAFSEATGQLRVLVLGAFGIATVKLIANSLTAQNWPLAGTGPVAVSLATTVALDLLLIPSMGGMGAAIASSVAYSIGGLAIAYVYSKKFDISMRVLVPRRGDVSAMFGVLRDVASRSK